MAKNTPATYDKKEQQAILAEADEAVKKALATVARKYPGVIIGHTLNAFFPSPPLVVTHSGNTRPLGVEKIAPPSTTEG